MAVALFLATELTRTQVTPSVPGQMLLGVWQLVSAKDYRPNGEAVRWLGKAPSGAIVYTPGGRMAVQFMRDPRATFAGASMWTTDGRDLLATVRPGEIRDAFTGYYAYYGTHTIDERAHTVTHHVQSSLRPQEVGLNYVRPFELTDEQLVFRYAVSSADGERRTRVITFVRSEPC